MAAVSAPGSSRGFEDYSVYSSLSDEELMQLAIERSLTDVQKSQNVPLRQTSQQNPSAQQQATTARHCSHNPPGSLPSTTGHYSSHNPPVQKPPDLRNFDGTVSRFITGSGKRMVVYRSSDGSHFHTAPETEEEEEPIFKAIREGNSTKLRALVLLPDTNLLLPSKPGWLPLHEAAHYGQERCLRILLVALPGMANKRTMKDQTPLLIAATKNHTGCVRVLLERGADPDLMNKDRETPLYKACERENPEVVAMLLNHSAAVNTSCIQGFTALHEAVYRNNVEICELLVKAGAKISPANIYGITPLFTAAQSGRVDSLRFILKHGADINSQASDSNTALYEATKNGHKEIVALLLSQKADANKPGKTGLLPLHVAAERGFDDIVNMLIPATSKTRVRRTGISPLHLAAERNRDDILETLIDAGFEVNEQLSEDRAKMYEDRRSTVLYFAVFNNNIEATTMLLDAGADPNLDLFNPLLVAARQGCFEAITLLVEHGANVNAFIPTLPTTFPAAVMFCMKYLTMLKYLMDNGGDALSCFSCIHGSGPHPPLKLAARSDRDNMRYQESGLRDEPQSGTVQFCEMISGPSICRWAGPIIDVLLNYVGHVQLCSRLLEHLDSYPEWEVIKHKATPPRPLMQLCRLEIRQLVGNHRLKKILTLPLPGTLIRFLNYEENTFEF